MNIYHSFNHILNHRIRFFRHPANHELLNLQLLLVQLVAEEVVLPVEVVNGVSVLLRHLRAALHLRPQNIDLLLSINQP